MRRAEAITALPLLKGQVHRGLRRSANRDWRVMITATVAGTKALGWPTGPSSGPSVSGGSQAPIVEVSEVAFQIAPLHRVDRRRPGLLTVEPGDDVLDVAHVGEARERRQIATGQVLDAVEHKGVSQGWGRGCGRHRTDSIIAPS